MYEFIFFSFLVFILWNKNENSLINKQLIKYTLLWHLFFELCVLTNSTFRNILDVPHPSLGNLFDIVFPVFWRHHGVYIIQIFFCL